MGSLLRARYRNQRFVSHVLTLTPANPDRALVVLTGMLLESTPWALDEPKLGFPCQESGCPMPLRCAPLGCRRFVDMFCNTRGLMVVHIVFIILGLKFDL